MENNDREIVAIEIDEAAHYRRLVHQLIPGARPQDAHSAWLLSLTEQSDLFAVPPDYKNRRALDLHHAVAVAVGINPTAKLDWVRGWQVDYRRDNRTTPPFAAKRLAAFLELLDMAKIDISSGDLHAHEDSSRAGGFIVKNADFKAWSEGRETLDPERRLARLRALGGTAKYSRDGDEWKFTKIAALVESEKTDGRKRGDEKTIRADLRAAAQTERDEKKAGFGAGLGQR